MKAGDAAMSEYLRDRGPSTLGMPPVIVDHDGMCISLGVSSMHHMPLCIGR